MGAIVKSVLYVIRRRPGIPADESTDMALVSGVFEQRTAVLFLDDGVYQLLGLAERQSSLKALPTYDVDDLYVAADSLQARQLSLAHVDLPVREASAKAIQALFASHDVILTD